MTGIFNHSAFQFINPTFCFIIGMALVGVLYLAAPKAKNSIGALLIVIVLIIVSLASSIGGMKIYFYKSQVKHKQDKAREELLDRGHVIFANQDSLLNQSNKFWTTYNLQKNQEATFADMISLSNAAVTDSTNMSSIYLISMQLADLTGFKLGIIEMLIMALFAVALDGAGVFCSGELTQNTHRSRKKGIARFFGGNKVSLITFKSYAKSLWKGVRKDFWETECLNSQNNIGIARRIEIKYRKQLTDMNLIIVKGTQTFSTKPYPAFMQAVSATK